MALHNICYCNLHKNVSQHQMVQKTSLVHFTYGSSFCRIQMMSQQRNDEQMNDAKYSLYIYRNQSNTSHTQTHIHLYTYKNNKPKEKEREKKTKKKNMKMEILSKYLNSFVCFYTRLKMCKNSGFSSVVPLCNIPLARM